MKCAVNQYAHTSFQQKQKEAQPPLGILFIGIVNKLRLSAHHPIFAWCAVFFAFKGAVKGRNA